LGNIGLSVYHALAGHPKEFEIVGIAVRDPARHREKLAAPGLLTADPRQIVEHDCDVVIELLGGMAPAGTLIEYALSRGKDVVSANREVLGRTGTRLLRLARERARELRYSAAIGSSLPILEIIDRLAAEDPIVEIQQISRGRSELASERPHRGESSRPPSTSSDTVDPRFKHDATDLAHRLAILARHAFGVDYDVDKVVNQGSIKHSDVDLALAARQKGLVLHWSGRCRRGAGQVFVEIKAVAVANDDPLAGAGGEEHKIQLGLQSGATIVLSGKSGGRLRAVESVVADIFSMRRMRSRGV
jgi:homoserine dehydrogenase